MSVARCKGSRPAPVGPCANEVPAGTGVPFLGNNNPGESKKQSSHLSWLQTHPSLDFLFIHLPLKNEKPKEGCVPGESSLGPRANVGVCNTKTNLCCGNLVSVEATLPWAAAGPLYIGSGSCMPLWPCF